MRPPRKTVDTLAVVDWLEGAEESNQSSSGEATFGVVRDLKCRAGSHVLRAHNHEVDGDRRSLYPPISLGVRGDALVDVAVGGVR